MPGSEGHSLATAHTPDCVGCKVGLGLSYPGPVTGGFKHYTSGQPQLAYVGAQHELHEQFCNAKDVAMTHSHL